MSIGTAAKYLGSATFYGLAAVVPLAAATTWLDSITQKSLLVTAIAIVAGLRILDGLKRREFRIAEPALLLPLGGILLLAAFQTWSLPGLPAISRDPYNTRVFFFVFGSLVIAFEALAFYADSDSRIKVLVGLVLAVGCGSAIFGFLGKMFPELQGGYVGGGIWPGEGFAQFGNRNHFAVLAEMPIGLLLGILISGKLSGTTRLIGWLSLAMLVIAVVASNSRGGMVSVAAIFVFAVFVRVMTMQLGGRSGTETKGGRFGVAKRRFVKGAAAVGLSLAAGVLVWTGIAFVGGDYVASRFERVDDELLEREAGRLNRNAIWRSTLDLVKERPILGSGFGAYSEAIPQFDRTAGRFHLQEAHNDYLEVLANGGVVGFAFFGLFGTLATVRIKRNITGSDPFRRSVSLGAAAGLIGVLVHSFVDFGLHVAVNAFVFVVLVVLATANRGSDEQSDAAAAL